MKALIAGLGSMGKRRIRNLKHLECEDIIGFDPREDRRQEVSNEYGILAFSSFDEALSVDPDAIVISTPPDFHYEYARQAAINKKHFFTEVGIGSESLDELNKLETDLGVVAAPSCTLRFHPVVQKMKKLLEEDCIGPILNFSSHSGQYLPDWHPWENYQDFWVSKKYTGACREQFILEAIWLSWLLGPIKAVSCMKEKLTALETDIDDVYQILVKHDTGVLGHMMLDVVARTPFRSGRMFSETGIIEWNLIERTLGVYSSETKTWVEESNSVAVVESGYVHAEQMYIDEMAHFLNAIAGEDQWMFPLTEERKIQETLEAVDLSSSAATHITL